MTLCQNGYFHQHDSAADAAACGGPTITHLRDIRRPLGQDFNKRIQAPVICAADVVTNGTTTRWTTQPDKVTCADCRGRIEAVR